MLSIPAGAVSVAPGAEALLGASVRPPAVESPPRVIIADGASRLDELFGASLRDAGYVVEVHPVTDELSAILRNGAADLFLIDMNLPQASGFELCGELRSTEAGRKTPIILLSSSAADQELIVRGLLCGADDCVVAVDRAERLHEVQARVRVQLRNKRERDRMSQLSKERDAYLRAAVVDTLTGVPNRRSLDSALNRAIAARQRFAVLFIDADHFKKINDELGHAVGDEVLRSIGACLRRSIRSGDSCGRYGGEEFLVLAQDVGVERATELAEGYRAAIEAISLPSLDRKLTASIGVATFDPEDPDASGDALCRRADAALYEAKRLGRNRVCAAPPLHPAEPVIVVPAPPPEPDPEDAVRAAKLEAALLRQLANGRAGLPLLPAAAAEALRLAEDPRTNMSQIAKLVERDPPLAARFVALASSAAFSRGARVSSTHVALVRVGLASARDLLLQVVYERSTTELPKYQAEVMRSFEHSVRTAVAARMLAHQLPRPYGGAYLCGLLHDIGEARIYRILATMDSSASARVVSDLVARHHERAGADVARAWRLPEDVVAACSLHHGSSAAAPTSVRIVMAAEALLRVAEGSHDPAADARMLASVGVSSDRLDALVERLEEELAPAAEEPPADPS